MNSNLHGHGWGATLTLEQRTAIKLIRDPYRGSHSRKTISGWSVFMRPTIGPAEYCELRLYYGRKIGKAWVIEKDGSTSLKEGKLERV